MLTNVMLCWNASMCFGMFAIVWIFFWGIQSEENFDWLTWKIDNFCLKLSTKKKIRSCQ